MELIGLSSFFIAIIVSINFFPITSEILQETFPDFAAFIPVISFLILFVGSILLLNIIGKSLKKVLDMTLLGSLDDILGAAIGGLKWLLIISLVVWAIEGMAGELPKNLSEGSVILPHIRAFIPMLVNLFSFFFPYFEGLDEYWQSVSNKSEYFTRNSN